MCKFRDFDKYEVYPDGRIWSYSHKKFLKPGTDTSGYQIVCLVNNEGKRKMYLVHRVVYEAVTGEPIPSNLECNHIDEDKTNCSFSNLNLLTHKENCNFGTRNSRAGKANSKANTNNTKRSKAVGAFKDGNLVMSFPSINEAQRQGFNSGNVWACCRGKLKSHKGFEWRYL